MRQRNSRSFAQALELYRQELGCDPAALSKQRRAEVFLKMGRVLLNLDKNQEALDSFIYAVEIFRQIAGPSEELRKEQAAAVLNEAVALTSLGRMDESLPIFHQARDLFKGLHDNHGEAYALQELARASFLLGENQSALSYCSQALKLHQEMDQRDRKTLEQTAVLLDYEGRIHAQMNEPDLAASSFREALVVARKTKYHRFVAYIFNDLGNLLLKQGKPLRAGNLHRRALNLLKKYDPDNTDGIAESEAYLAATEAASGNYELAAHNYQDALLLQKKSGDRIGQAETHFLLGLMELRAHHPEAAVQSLREAAALFHQAHERAGESNAAFQIARIDASQKDDAGARTEVEKAIQLGEEIRTFTPGSRSRAAYFVSLESMYRFAMDIILQQSDLPSEGDQRRAFDLLQRAQSRTLLDALEAGSGRENAPDSAGAPSRRAESLKQLKVLNLKLEAQLRDKSKATDAERTYLEVTRVESRLDQIDAEDRAAQPRLELLSPTSLSIADIQQQLLDQDTAFIQFYLSTPYSYSWVITRTGAQVFRLPSKTALEQKVRSSLRFGEGQEWTKSQGDALQELHRSLASTFQAAGRTRWIIVPDGVLHYFPFALLARTIKVDAEIIKVPSAAALRAIRLTGISRPPHLKVAVMADPVFDAQDSRVRHRETSRGGGELQASHRGRTESESYPRLLYSRQEAREIAKLVLPDQRASFLDFAAQLSAVGGNALDGYSIIHFATHSRIDTRHSDLSRIVLSLVTKSGERQPGYLMLKEIYRMKLASNLVVLSSCRSALGSQTAGEGPMSLARGFLFAGSRSVLATLWAVDDEATARFVAHFYRCLLKENCSPLEALARAQSDFQHDSVKRFHNPYYWAAFELYGDWQVH